MPASLRRRFRDKPLENIIIAEDWAHVFYDMDQVEDNKSLPGFLRSQRLVDARTTSFI